MAILANEKVLTLDYWKPASKLQVGDYVFDKNGKLVKVKLVQEYMADTCYRLHLNDFLCVAGDKNLEFLVENKKYRNRAYTYKGKKKFTRPLKPMPVTQLSDLDLKEAKYSIPTTKPLEFPWQDLPVNPFVFGFWFFNRRSDKKLIFTRGNMDYIEAKFKDSGYKIRKWKKVNTGEHLFSVTPTIESQLVPNIPTKIPANYLLASVEQRIALLSGILYAKNRQYNRQNDRFQFTSSHLPTILQIQHLVESLGHKTTVMHRPQLKNYTIYFRSRLQLVENQNSPKLKVHLGRRYIREIEPIKPQMCVHIETDGQDNSILVGEGFIACH